MELTASMEDYLEAILRLADAKRVVGFAMSPARSG